jgi:hypothetical protein
MPIHCSIRTMASSIALLCCALTPSAQAAESGADATAHVLHCGHLFDSISGTLKGETSVTVQGDRITSV